MTQNDVWNTDMRSYSSFLDKFYFYINSAMEPYRSQKILNAQRVKIFLPAIQDQRQLGNGRKDQLRLHTVFMVGSFKF